MGILLSIAGTGLMDNDEEEHDELATVSSSIMLKLPTFNLSKLRRAFESDPNEFFKGLNLKQYLVALVDSMLIKNKKELDNCVADLLDFFDFVDINGDGYMEWNEFVAFIIEQCAFEQDHEIHERLEHKGTQLVQPSSARCPIKCSKYFPIFNRILEGVGSEVQFHEPNNNFESWSSCSFKMPLFDRSRTIKNADDSPVIVLDMLFQASCDTLMILRSDFCFECCQFISKSKLSLDTICNRMAVPLSQSFVKIALRDETSLYSTRLFAIGPMNQIFSWEFSEGIRGQLDLCNELKLEKHTDFINDIMVIKNDLHECLVSCSLDRKVCIWDLTTLQYKMTKTGHNAGVQCLAFDGQSILIAGGFDYRIIAWDLDNILDIPVWQMCGHTSPIIKVVISRKLDRCVSLDESGEIRYDLIVSQSSQLIERNTSFTV